MGNRIGQGRDGVTAEDRTWGLGFEASSVYQYPFLGAGTFGHSGAAGGQALASPREGFGYAYTRRRFPFPFGPATENTPLLTAVLQAVSSAQ